VSPSMSAIFQGLRFQESPRLSAIFSVRWLECQLVGRVVNRLGSPCVVRAEGNDKRNVSPVDWCVSDAGCLCAFRADYDVVDGLQLFFGVEMDDQFAALFAAEETDFGAQRFAEAIL